MRKLLLIAATAASFASAAHADYNSATGKFSPGGAPLSADNLNDAIGKKVNTTNGTLFYPTIQGQVSVNGPFVWLSPNQGQLTTYAAGGLTNGIIISTNGNTISYCPVLSCVTSPSADHQRTSALFWSTTADDGHSEEQTVAIETIIGTGYAKPWAVGTNYAVGDNVQFPAANTVYRAIVAGRSASSGTGPTGKGADIVDGTVHWAWINDQAINAKVGLYNETVVMPGAGQSWSQANNVHLRPGVIPSFNMNTELDFTNDAAECIAPTNCNALEISMGGAYRSTNAIHVSSGNVGPTYASRWGLRFNGDYISSDATIEVTTTSAVGLGFGTIGFGTSHHSTASIQDNSTSPTSILIQGTHANQSINDTATTPAALNLAGSYSLAAIYTGAANTPNALSTKDNQKVCLNGSDACFVHSVPLGKLYYIVNGVAQFSVSDTGNVIFKGSITQNSTP